MQNINAYFAALRQVLEELPQAPINQFVDLLADARQQERTIFVFGNGGSASTASHFACDLVKNTVREGLPPLKAIALNDNLPGLTAYANDEGYETVFAQPLRVLAAPGDVAVAISCSGNSPNVLRALETARAMELSTVGITGFRGGKLVDLAALSIVVPCDDMRVIEDAHLAICHAVHDALLQA
jgi:D-sedoheptulose 7-phosphate isomerase